MTKLRKLVVAALLLATTIVLGRFLSIKTPIIIISFSYLPIMIAGILLGPWWTSMISALADLVGALLFPFGAYFPGYTLSAALSGFIYGILLRYNPKQSNKVWIIKLVIAVLTNIVLCNTLLNTLWIYITTKRALFVILPTRLFKQLIMFPVQVITVFIVHVSFKKTGIYAKFFGTVTDAQNQETEKTLKQPVDSGVADDQSK